MAAGVPLSSSHDDPRRDLQSRRGQTRDFFNGWERPGSNERPGRSSIRADGRPESQIQSCYLHATPALLQERRNNEDSRGLALERLTGYRAAQAEQTEQRSPSSRLCPILPFLLLLSSYTELHWPYGTLYIPTPEHRAGPCRIGPCETGQRRWITGDHPHTQAHTYYSVHGWPSTFWSGHFFFSSRLAGAAGRCDGRARRAWHRIGGGGEERRATGCCVAVTKPAAAAHWHWGSAAKRATTAAVGPCSGFSNLGQRGLAGPGSDVVCVGRVRGRCGVCRGSG